MSQTQRRNTSSTEEGVNERAESPIRTVHQREQVHIKRMDTDIVDPLVLGPSQQSENSSRRDGSSSSRLLDRLRGRNSKSSRGSSDQENNLPTQRDSSTPTPRWMAGSDSRIPNSSNLSENLRMTSSSSNSRRTVLMRRPGVHKSYHRNRSYRIKKNVRRVVIMVFFALVLSTAYLLSVKMVDYIDKRVARDISKMTNILKGTQKNAANNQDLNQVIDELRMEIQKLKELSYKNSLAISGLSNGVYRVPGSEEDSETVKKNKFGKTSNTVSLNANIHRQDVKSNKKRKETEEFVPDTIEYDANITLQS